MRPDLRTTSTLIVAGLLAAACGADDEPAAEDDVVGQSIDDAGSDGAQDDAAGDDGAQDDGADDDGAVDDDGSDDDSGSNSDAQQSRDDAGVDLDLDELEESIGNLSTGEGGGTVTIDGVVYTFEATAVCIVQGNDFVAEGLGQDPNGDPAWVSISASMQDFDGDGDEGASIDVYVEPGRVELFGDGPDDAPDFSASYWEDFGTGQEEIVYELSDGGITGSGPIQDFSGIAIPFGETRDMSFEASCG